jgi:hypothetical protein
LPARVNCLQGNKANPPFSGKIKSSQPLDHSIPSVAWALFTADFLGLWRQRFKRYDVDSLDDSKIVESRS